MASNTLHTKGPANVDSLLATTVEAVRKGKELLKDQIFQSIPLLNWLNSKARVTLQGGASILVPLMFGKNETFKAYRGDDILDTTGQEGLTMAQATWRNYGGTVKLAGDEVRANAGSGKLIDLTKARINQAMMSGRDKIAIDFHAASQAAKAIHTLVTLIDATSTIQDINSTTYSWWQAQVSASGSFSGQGLADMRLLRDLIIRQGQSGAPMSDLILTDATTRQYYEASQVPQLRYASRGDADASFGALKFSGANVEFDPNNASGVMYFLSSEALEFVVHSDADLDMGDFVEPTNQDVRVSKILWAGNLVVHNRRRLGKLTGITA